MRLPVRSNELRSWSACARANRRRCSRGAFFSGRDTYRRVSCARTSGCASRVPQRQSTCRRSVQRSSSSPRSRRSHPSRPSPARTTRLVGPPPRSTFRFFGRWSPRETPRTPRARTARGAFLTASSRTRAPRVQTRTAARREPSRPAGVSSATGRPRPPALPPPRHRPPLPPPSAPSPAPPTVDDVEGRSFTRAPLEPSPRRRRRRGGRRAEPRRERRAHLEPS